MSSGLAAVIATGGSLAADRLKAGDEFRLRRCEIANTFLSDDAPSPYMTDQARQRLTRSAANLLARCLKEER